MNTVIGLQELINQKAELRLKRDLGEISEMIRNNRLFSITDNPSIPDLTYDGKEQKPFWIFQRSSKYMDEVKKYWLPIYQNEEAQNFIQKIDDINKDVNDLMNNQTYD